jgi:hypothetical protein
MLLVSLLLLLCVFSLGKFPTSAEKPLQIINLYTVPMPVLSSMNGDNVGDVGDLRGLAEKIDSRVRIGERRPWQTLKDALFRNVKNGGLVELRGVLPVPLEERTSTQYSNFVSDLAPLTSYFLTSSRGGGGYNIVNIYL